MGKETGTIAIVVVYINASSLVDMFNIFANVYFSYSDLLYLISVKCCHPLPF